MGRSPWHVSGSRTINISGTRRRAWWQVVPSHLFLNLCISFMKSCTLLPPMCFSNHEDVSISGKLFDLLCTHTYDSEGEVAWPEHLHNFISMIHEEDEFSDEQEVFCLHTHFKNLHFVGCLAYWLTPCTHLGTSVILLKPRSIILIQTILNRNCYNNGGLHMNLLLIFGSASMTCSFKLWGAKWNLHIFGTGSSTALRNLPIPRESLRSSLAKDSSLMELRNLMWKWALSQLTVCLPLIQQLHHYLVMLRIMLTLLFILHTLPTSLHSLFT